MFDVTEPPADLIRKIKALQKLQTDVGEIDAAYKQERIALETKYRDLKNHSMKSRDDIISGDVEVLPEPGDEPGNLFSYICFLHLRR